MRFFALLGFICLYTSAGFAQVIPEREQPVKIAIIAPLFIDSAFDNGIIKERIPSLMNSGLEFIQGAEIALDTISTQGKKVQAYIIDSRAPVKNLEWMMKYGGLDQMDIIIGGVKEPEYRDLAEFARDKRIPFVSAVYPNDGAVRNDSFLIILNSTLLSNIEGIYSYLVQKHSMEQILLLKQRNDNRIDDIFKRLNKSTGKDLLKIQSVAVDSINAAQLSMLIDTLKPAVVIGATLNEWFALNVADACYPYRSKVTLIGMPNWDGFRNLYNKDRYKDFPILFTTPHSDEEKNAFTDYLANQYFTKYRAKPSDMASKGFEAAWYFTNLALHFPGEILDHLNENQFACFHEFNFRPVVLNRNGDVDYFENKHVFIMQILNGLISRVW